MTKIITWKLMQESNNFPELINHIEKYYCNLQAGTVSVTNRIFSQTQDGGVYVIGGATNYETESFIVMSQIVMPWLRDQALPVATTSYLYSNFRTGELKAVVGGGDLVRFRTAAKSALAAKYLAPKKEEYTLGLIGLNIQAVTHAEAFKSIFNVKRIVATSRTPDKWKHNLDEIGKRTGIEVEILDKNDVIAQSDILVLITSAKEVLVEYSALHKGQLVISTEHAETVSKDAALKVDKVFIDYRPTAENEIGTVKTLLSEGKVYEDIVDGDLIDVVTKKKGRESEDEIIFFQSLGVMNENLAAVEYFYDKLKDSATEVQM